MSFKPVPINSVFGHSTWSPFDSQEPLVGRTADSSSCTNPASLGGGSGQLDSASRDIPRRRQPDTGHGTAGSRATPWYEYRGAYQARCVSSGGNNVLEGPRNGAPPLYSTGALAPLWGLHQLDVNLALGNVVALVASETRAYLVR